MEPLREVQPLSYTKRRRTFFFLLAIFIISLPFLYLYATGYRFDFDDPNAIVGTGGIYVAAERTGAEIYIDNELVRETRVFRTAFYAQNLDPRTHRVHVQKEGHHTWVKELPVTSHRVTEAQAFNMPIVPNVRVVSEWVSATGSAVVRTVLPYASTTNEVIATTTKATSTFTMNPEYAALLMHFTGTSTVSASESKTLIERLNDELSPATTTEVVAPTTTRESGGVRLSRGDSEKVYAEWKGPFEEMPYYYCAPSFPRYSTTTELDVVTFTDTPEAYENAALLMRATEAREELESEEFVHPVQQIDVDTPCDRRIEIVAPDKIRGFEFFPGSTDFVVLELETGIYMNEIDNRAWQNTQPLLLGEDLHVHVENGSVYVYDGALIYQIVLDQ